ncbi:TPA: EpsG family protein, partial [Klebsiella michiganensis]|nr:EpsG family protein [Klebsiella michiganensis]
SSHVMESRELIRPVLLSSSLLIFLCILLSVYSPILGFYIPLILLCFDFFNLKKLRYFLCIISIFSCAFFAASRNVISGNSYDDLLNVYYPAYLDIINGGSIFVSGSSGGVEFLFYGYLKAVYYLFDIRTQTGLIFFVSIFCLIGFYIWLEKFGTENVSDRKKSLCIASALGLFGFFSTSQIMRQCFSTVFVLFSISYFEKGNKFKFSLFFILASISHMVSIVIIPLVIIIKRNNKKINALIAVLAILFSVFFPIVTLIIVQYNLLGSASIKMLYYFAIPNGVSGGLITTFTKLLIIMMLFGWFFFSNMHKNYKSLMFFGGIIYLSLLPIPQASERLLQILSTFLVGYLAFLSTYKISNIYRVLLAAFLLYRIFVFGPFLPDGNLAFMDFWKTYPWSSDDAFYYLKYIR